MTPFEDHPDEPTADEVAALGALLLAERPRPSQAFAAELDARLAERFAGPPRGGPASARARRDGASAGPRGRGGRPAPPAAGLLARGRGLLARPLLPAAATALAVGLVALVVALNAGGGSEPLAGGGAAVSAPSSADTAAGGAAGDAQAPPPATANAAPAEPDLEPPAPSGREAGAAPERAPLPATFGSARKVERAASLELGTGPDRVDDVAQDVLGVVARFGGIVDSSSVQTAAEGGEARFELRIPAARLQPALAALSRLPDAHVLGRTDEAVDVNQAYVSVRRRLANARAERAGVTRALANAETEDETLRLRARLDGLERTIAQAERAQRGLDRRVDYGRVSVTVRGGAGGGLAVPGDDGAFTLGDAARDALRVLEVAAGVVVIAAAALVPVALLAALAWPLARAGRRRRREQALDAA